MKIVGRRTTESPQAIAMRLTAEHGAARALEVCEGIAATKYPPAYREPYREAARILAAAIKGEQV